jgi:hypothetical protein
MSKKTVDILLNFVFEGLNSKQLKVLNGRYGLKSGHISTLQEIGDELGLTRERVRQIEEQTIKKIKPKVEKEAAWILDFASKHLANSGGVRRDDYFISDLKNTIFNNEKTKNLGEKIRFIFLAAEAPLYQKENNDFYSFWYKDQLVKKSFEDFVKNILHLFKTANKHSLLYEKVYFAHCQQLNSAHFLSISKHFGTNVFGELGLRSWPEIEPKTARDKAYLVLKKHGAPLHFREIARHINLFGIDKKPAHVQTVHNELIKDDRFVLVGRGVYALRENGFEPGTAREVIARLLREKGPLDPSEVVRLVKEERFFKENTILLSLQNKKYFRRLDDGRYHIREA